MHDRYYDRKKKVLVLCLAGALLLLRPKKKVLVVCLVGARSLLRPEKKRYSCLSGRLCCCISFLFWQEISIFFVVVGNFDYDRKKKRYSRLSGGCAIIITTGTKKDTVVCLASAQSLLRPEKKRYSHLSGGCAIMSVFLVAIVIFVLVQLELYLIQICSFNFNISVTYKVDTYNTLSLFFVSSSIIR